jgi:hypothetical protein
MCSCHAAEEEDDKDADGAVTEAVVAEGRAIEPSRKEASTFFATGVGREWKPKKSGRDFWKGGQMQGQRWTRRNVGTNNG